MDQSTLIQFLVLVFATVFLLSQILLVPSFGTSGKDIKLFKKRLKNVSGSETLKQVSLVREKYLKQLNPFERWLESFSVISPLEGLVEQAGGTYPAYRVLLAIFVLGVFGGVVTWFITSNYLAALAMTLFGAWAFFNRSRCVTAPLALDGPSLSIRRFSVDKLKLEDLVGKRSISAQMVVVLKAMVEISLNILISGGTGSGKTTMLNALSNFIPENERIVTIEDSAELQLQQAHKVRLETRPSNIEGKGTVTQRDLLKNALRMRPDRIVVGEVRGEEAFDMLQAMNTGHDGSLTTIHANTPRDSLARVENMVSMAGYDLPAKTIRQQIASAIDVVLQLERHEDGTRRVTSIAEITGMEGEVISMSEIFRFVRTGLDEKGNVMGNFKATGMVPRFYEKIKTHNIDLDIDVFDTLE